MLYHTRSQPEPIEIPVPALIDEVDWDVLQTQLAEVEAERKRLTEHEAMLEKMAGDSHYRRERATALLTPLDNVGDLAKLGSAEKRRNVLLALGVEVHLFPDRTMEITGEIAPSLQHDSAFTSSVMPQHPHP